MSFRTIQTTVCSVMCWCLTVAGNASFAQSLGSSSEITEKWFVDTLEFDCCVVVFELADSLYIPPYYDDQTMRDELITGVQNTHVAANKIEAYLNNVYPNLFQIQEDSILLFLKEGKTVSFPKWDMSSDKGYCFDNYFSEYELILLYVQFSEGNGFALVNRNNGQAMSISGLPHFTSNNKSIMTRNIDLDAGYSFNGLEYYQRDNERFMKLFSIETGNWGPTSFMWLTDSTALIRADYWTTDTEGLNYGKSHLRMNIYKKEK